MARMISCPGCGRIHPYGQCPRGGETRKKYRGRSELPTATSFRSTWAWTEKSRYIRDRDHYLCQACLYNLDGMGIRYTHDHLEVHHIESLESAYDKRLDDDNLITLCRDHHEQAEQGKLTKQQLKQLIEERAEGKGSNPPIV